MSYTEQTDDAWALLRKTLTGIADFTGRSRRKEVICYLIAQAVISAIVRFVTFMTLSTAAYTKVSEALQLFLMLPIFALFVRRLHDQSRSGLWGLLLPLSLLMDGQRVIARLKGDPWTSPPPFLISVAGGVCGLIIVIFCFWRGTEGSNRFGPDPRLRAG